jgi:hypothetical protein
MENPGIEGWRCANGVARYRREPKKTKRPGLTPALSIPPNYNVSFISEISPRPFLGLADSPPPHGSFREAASLRCDATRDWFCKAICNLQANDINHMKINKLFIV